MTDHEIVLEIQELLSGTWSPATLDQIAELLDYHGYKIEGID